MITGTTRQGFEFAVGESMLNDMELMEELVHADQGDGAAMVNVASRVLGQQKEALYDYLRNEDGRVPVDEVFNAIQDIFAACKEGKKS